LWYQVEPSLTWLPFLRMRCLHFGHVPMGHSFPSSRPRRPYYSKRHRRIAVRDCLFCRIAARRSPAEIVYEDDEVVAFKDIYPKAPVHMLIVPRRHIASLVEAGDEDVAALGRCVLAARRLAQATGYAEKGFRLSVNTGPEGGQVVYHVHFHFTAGRRQRADA
jgi:histidine triad (HIT) family protein